MEGKGAGEVGTGAHHFHPIRIYTTVRIDGYDYDDDDDENKDENNNGYIRYMWMMRCGKR